MTIFKKDLKSQLSSPGFYIIIGLFCLVSGWIFFSSISSYMLHVQQLPAQMRKPLDFFQIVIFRYFGQLNILLLLICPVFSMKVFASEYEDGTINLLYSSLNSDWTVILNKYLFLLCSLTIVLGLSLVVPLTLALADFNDFTFLLTSYLSLFLNICLYSAIGLLCSIISQTQMTSAISCFIGLLFFWMIAWGINLSSNYFLVENLKFISLVDHYHRISQANPRVSDFSYYLSLIFLSLFLAKKKYESRNWRRDAC